MGFIQLTKLNGHPVLVDLDRVITVEPTESRHDIAGEEGSAFFLETGTEEGHLLCVSESFDAVCSRMRGAFRLEAAE